MNRVALVVAIWASAAVAAGSVTASLTPAEKPDPAIFPYARATLILFNDGPGEVETVRLRPAGGGPAVRYAMAVPPREEAELEVALPAIWPVQRYRVEAIGAGGTPVGQAQAGVGWPAEVVATGAFIDDAYLPWRDVSAAWPVRTRRDALLVLCVFAAAAGGVLLVRRGWVRSVLMVLLAAGTAVTVALAPDWPGGANAEAHVLALHAGGRTEVQSFTVLSARRSCSMTVKTEGIPWPVYPDKPAAVADRSVVDPAARTLTAPMTAGRTRVIRPARRAFKPAPGTAGSVTTKPAGEMDIRARMDHRRALLVTEDRCWHVPAGYGRMTETFRPDAAATIWSVLSRPKQWDLDRRLVRMLSYWRQRYQEPGHVYLLNFSEAPDEVRLVVLRLDAQTAKSQ